MHTRQAHLIKSLLTVNMDVKLSVVVRINIVFHYKCIEVKMLFINL